MFRKRVVVRGVMIALGSLAAAPIGAQQSTAPGADASSGGNASTSALPRVVVTAQHREENIQEIPVAVTAVDTEHVTEDGLRNFDLFTFVPNAAAENPDGESRPRIYIRGLGTGDTAASTVFPVGVYADGIYLNAPIATGGALFDLERVEVLRGPQGTLYGKNTTGGAINYLSRKPEFTKAGGNVVLGVGSDRQRTFEGAVGGAVTDVLAARAAFYYETRDGFVDNLTTGEKQGGIDKKAFRLQFLFKPSSDLDALVKLHNREYTGNGSNGSLPLGTYYPGTAAQYTRPNGRVIEGSINNTQKIEHEGISLTVNKKLGDYLLTSITGYDSIKDNSLGGGGTTPAENHTRSLTDNRWRQASQELRLTSPKEEALRWIAGLHYFQENLDSNAVATRYQAALANLPVGAPAAQSAGSPGYRDTYYTHDTRSIAAYGNVTYDFTEKFSLTGGLRWTEEKKDLDISLLQYNVVNFNAGNFWETSSLIGSPTPNINGSRVRSAKWRSWTWDLTPEYRVSDNLRTFFRYARGFRSGGFNVGIGGNLDAVNEVKPEYLDSYEVGVKSEWLGGRLLVNANVFYYDYRDIQTNLLIPQASGGVVTALSNGPKAKARGAELELDARPIESLRLRLALGFLDAEYTDFVNRNPLTGVVSGDNTGNALVRSPKFTLGGGAAYTFRLGLPGQFVAASDVSFRTKEYFLVDRQTDADGPLGQGAYAVWNARLTYVTADKRIRITGYVNNLTDKLYQVHGRPNGTGAGNYVVTYGNPRTVGISVAAAF